MFPESISQVMDQSPFLVSSHLQKKEVPVTFTWVTGNRVLTVVNWFCYDLKNNSTNQELEISKQACGIVS
jgi:hypothetical protein